MKIMLDTNAFDYLYDQDLIEQINQLVEKKKISLFYTHIQKDEIEKISDEKKREKISKIKCNKLITSVGFVGTDNTKRGFSGLKIEEFQIIDDNEAKIIEKIKTNVTLTHPLGNSADVAIIYTSIKNNLDYLVSDDSKLKQNASKLNPSLKVISNSDFAKILRLIK